MSTLYITVGPPASGKSFWAQSRNLPVVSTDAIRREINGNESDQSNNEKVFSTARERVCAFLVNGQDVIYDATNMGYRNRKAIIAEARKLRNISVNIVAHVFVVPIDILYERNMTRERSVPIDVIDNMLSHFQPPCEWEKIDKVVYHITKDERTLSELLALSKEKTANVRASELCVKRSLAEACLYLDVAFETAKKGHAGHSAYIYLAAGGTPENAALIAYHELPDDMDAYDKMRKVMPIDFTYDLDLVHEADVRSHI